MENEEVKIEGSIDINEALKEFEEKTSQEQATKIVAAREFSNMPKMVKLVIKWSGGAIKEQREAEYVLLGFAILVFIISLFIFFS
ncbi:MAG: hypothetical protein UW07_C0056G0004 [Candidatus Nomurabacteria bacterium GW2011_GWF2_43_8]|uniref:Uncharacterized protein n=3 Tax=Candidatus Nomuraibacteriota TaxID=1752729 RepID=A0A0G1FH70_9BACT|nr:MAG: hypothetical protein UV76_C0002G0065 [Candidatus Nomurabacteria bacterium GW2011_GWA2_43_15]KKT19891.1 MAG: hypothetical protein UW02_C0004G0068 [Candidatus Nomurabacteria bacterium GW2011_GWB1_43_7]KKT21745.1 MAG: hypothetical protein UW07_C0056G0004 [Candidatus Nomurabacteria bacterium GW2011_GWF2_43_8]